MVADHLQRGAAMALTGLAHWSRGDLDDGRPLTRIVGKALELMGTTWERAGILKDAYSDPVLTSQGYLTLNDTLETPEITVVRSPRLLESGVPGPLIVLPNGLTPQARHHLKGKTVRCHNDFTPDGIRVTNDILAWTGGTAWRSILATVLRSMPISCASNSRLSCSFTESRPRISLALVRMYPLASTIEPRAAGLSARRTT